MFGAVHLDDTSFGDGKEYKPQVAYSQTKSANVLYSKELARRLASKGVISFSLHPGGKCSVEYVSDQPRYQCIPSE